MLRYSWKLRFRLSQQLMLLLAILLTSKVMANETLIFGHEEKIFSKVLNEERTLLINLPAGYDASTNRQYPVLYTLDGNTHFKRVVGTVEWLSRSSRLIEPHIIVAITNTNRFRDLSTSVPKDSPADRNAGGANNFIRFLADELIPHINKKYRTTDFKTLAGHSFGGLFTLHTMLTKGELFQAYIAMSPFVRFDDMELVKRAAKQLKANQSLTATLFMTLGYEPNLQQGYDDLVNILNKHAPKSLQWQSHIYELENHMSTPSKTLHNALLAISLNTGYMLHPKLIAQGFDTVKQHYLGLSKKLGRMVSPPEGTVNSMGYGLLSQEKIEEAIEVFTYNNNKHPESTNTYDSLADAMEAKGQFAEAKVLLVKAVQLATEQKHQGLAQLQNHLKAVEEKLVTL
ncbi:MAG: alpha/beta hydrolase [Colwellia sp.]|nr:alpha/beta hydrolase [Colwellia sp.]